MQSTTPEAWKAIPGYEGLYEVSDQGRVRSLDREYVRSDGVATRRRGRTLKPVVNTNGRHQVYLCIPGSKQKPCLVHRLVLEAFVGPCPEGMEACHYNDTFTDNRLCNLRWDTREANTADRIRNGVSFGLPKAHCPKGHPYDDVNTYVNPNTGGRLCRECSREHDRRRYKDRVAVGCFREAGARYRERRKSK